MGCSKDCRLCKIVFCDILIVLVRFTSQVWMKLDYILELKLFNAVELDVFILWISDNYIHVRGYWRGIRKRQSRENSNIRRRQTKQNKKHKHATQDNTIFLQTTGSSKDEPNIVPMRKSSRTSQHRTENVVTHDRKKQKTKRKK